VVGCDCVLELSSKSYQNPAADGNLGSVLAGLAARRPIDVLGSPNVLTQLN